MANRFQPEDLWRFRYVSWPTLSQDGTKAAHVVKTAQEGTGLHIPQIHWMNLADRADHTLPMGTHAPVFLRDSSKMLCLSGESGEDQVWLYDLTGGSKRQITHLRHGVKRFSVSPDESRILFEAILWPEEVENGTALTEMTAEEKSAWEEELDMRPYYVTELVYKMDEWYGMRKGEYEHIGVAEIATGASRILPTGMAGIYPAFSPDGGKAAFYGYPYHDASGYAVELFLIDLSTGDMQQLTNDLYITRDHCPIFTPDGSAVITMAYQGSAIAPYRIELANQQTTCLIGAADEEITHGVNPLMTSRTENGAAPAYAYLREGYLYFLGGRDSRTCICRVPEKGGKVELVMPAQTDIQGFFLGTTGDLALAMGDLSAPPEFCLNGERLTDHNAWLRAYPQGRVEEFWIPSRDGKVRLHYYLMHPVEEVPGVKYPAVLDIHGGPTCMYGAAYWHEFHALAAQGFAVIYGDPRGSIGYGKDFCAGGVCWSLDAMHDLEDMLAHAVAQGFIDEKRLGVTGGSYGGYMVNKLIGRTKHFSAAVTQRSLANPATSYGTGDMGFVSAGKISKHFSMLDYLEDRARGNIISFIDNMDVPLCILHAFRDYRCSFEQGEQMFIAMKERHPDVPVRLVMFPDENHALTRTGKCHNQVRHLQELVGWFVKYLQKEDAKDE